MLALTAILLAAAPVRLDYRAAGTSCPDKAALAAAVRERLGYEPFTEGGDDVIEVVITSSGQALSARIVGKRGRRELASPTTDCTELFKALHLAVAIAIDPRAGLVSPPPEPLPAAPPAPKPPPPTPLTFHAGAGLLGAAGTGPQVTGGLSALAGLRYGLFQADVGGRVELPVGVQLEAARVTTQALAAEGAGCLAVSLARACLLFTLGGLRVQGPDVGTVLVLATAGTRLAADWQFSKLFIARAFFDLAAHLARTTVLYRGVTVWEMPPVMGTLGLALLLTSGG
ncbi:MAG: hypothetical protein JNK82_13840 [Myxococcaceae bacterium]|nr:hypothetical protein [Myxococcaceae bacterium]